MGLAICTVYHYGSQDWLDQLLWRIRFHLNKYEIFFNIKNFKPSADRNYWITQIKWCSKIFSFLPIKQKLMLQESFWFPFLSALNEKDLNESLKLNHFSIIPNMIRKYRKSEVLSKLAETLVVETAPAKHWFWIISTVLDASLASLTEQSLIYLKEPLKRT